MKKEKTFVIYDILIVIVALVLSLMLRFDFTIPKEYIGFLKLSIIPVILITLLFNKLFKLYNNIWEFASVEELLTIVYSVTLSNIAFIIYSYFVSYKLFENIYFRFPFTVHIIFWLLSVMSLGGVRFLFRMIYEKTKSEGTDFKHKKVRVLIIGAGAAAALLIKEIRNNGKLNYEIVGLVDDDKSKIHRYVCGVKVLGSIGEVPDICFERNVQEVILAIPSLDYQAKRQIIAICKDTNTRLRTLPGIDEVIDRKVSLSNIRDVNIEDLLGREEIKLNSPEINEYLTNKVVLVTGGGGSIGSELCRQIAKFQPNQLLILDIYENNAYNLDIELRREYPNLKKEVLIASIRDKIRLNNIFETYKPDVVFHAAAHKHVPLMEENPAEAIKNNILGTYNVVKCSDEYKVKKFVQISTDKAVNPTNIMGASKRFCEMIIQAFDRVSETEYVAVRFGNVLGSNGSVIPIFKNQIAQGGPVTVTHPEITRYFMTIPEAAQLVIQAGAMAKGGEIFVLDMGEPVKMVDLARDLITLSGFRPDIDIKIEFTGLRPGEKLYEELLMDEIALTSTEHHKIFIEKPGDVNINDINASIEEFRNSIGKDPEEIFQLVQQKVPTYQRKKS